MSPQTRSSRLAAVAAVVGVLLVWGAATCTPDGNVRFRCEDGGRCSQRTSDNQPYVCYRDFCHRPDEVPAPDAGEDAGTDAGHDAGTDAGTDAGHDAGDPGPYAGFVELPAPCINGICVEHPSSGGRYLYGVWGTSPEDLWAVGAAGTALHWDGLRWRRADAGAAATLRSVWGDGRNWWVVGEGGYVGRWASGGFQPVDVGMQVGTANLNAVTGVGDAGEFMLAVGDSSRYVMVEGGAIQAGTFPESVDLNGVWSDGAGVAWLVGSGGSIFRFAGDPDALEPNGIAGMTSDIVSVHGATSNAVYAVTVDGGILGLVGGTWSEVAQGNGLYHDVWASQDGLWLPTDRRREIDYWLGQEVLVSDAGTNRLTRAVWAADDANVYVVGDKGVVLHNDGGFEAPHWSYVSGATLFRLAAMDAYRDRMFAVGDGKTLLQREGDHWVSVGLPRPGTGTDYRAVFVGPTQVWIGTDDELLRLDDAGLVVDEANATGAAINDFWGIDGVPHYAVGGNSTILRYDVDTGDWVADVVLDPVPTEPIEFVAVAGNPVDGFLIAITEDRVYTGGLNYLAESTYKPNFTGFRDIWVNTYSEAWMTGPGNYIHRLRNGTWTSFQIGTEEMRGVNGQEGTRMPVYAVGTGGVYVLQNHQEGWDGSVGFSQEHRLIGVQVTDAGVWVVGTDGFIGRMAAP